MKEITKEIRINLEGIIQSDLDCITSTLEENGYVKRDYFPHPTYMHIYPEGKYYVIYCHDICKECLTSPKDFIKEYIMETKTVKLTLEQAKELYNQGGNFKTIALGAYSEKELTEPNLPNNWGEFCENYPIKKVEYYVTDSSEIESCIGNSTRSYILDKNNLPNKETAEAMLALCQLIQLRDCYNHGWKPDWNDSSEDKFVIYNTCNNLVPDTVQYVNCIMHFKTEELRDKFFDNFKDLLEQAKELL